jgi:hypothetical protein
MPYSATAYRLLISAPGDVPEADIDAVMDAVERWNAVYGPEFGAVVVPVHWRAHTAAEHGVRPQESINKQLVDRTDIVIALFWHRIGTETGRAESGTIEEIEEAQAAGAYVGILRCRRDYPLDVDTEQLDGLRTFFQRIRPDSLMLDYDDDATLARHVDNAINRAVTRAGARAEAAADQAPAPREAEVWPRIERFERTRSSGRPMQEWQLILAIPGVSLPAAFGFGSKPRTPETTCQKR